MQNLVTTLKTTQKENFDVEDDTLARLNSLKALNQGLVQLKDEQSHQFNEANIELSNTQADHERILEGHNPEVLASSLNELEETLLQLRLEVDEVSAQNEVTKLDADKQSRLNRLVRVDRAPIAAQLSELKDLETRQLEAKDKERDANIDIYQLAMTYQRKVEEFESLLTDYSKDGGDVQSQI